MIDRFRSSDHSNDEVPPRLNPQLLEQTDEESHGQAEQAVFQKQGKRVCSSESLESDNQQQEGMFPRSRIIASLRFSSGLLLEEPLEE